MFKQILASIVLAVMAMPNPASAEQSTSEQAKRIEAMVNKAAVLVSPAPVIKA